LSKGIEFSGEGWDCYKRLVKLKVDGKEVVVARAQAVPWKELNWVGKVTITDYLDQDRSEEGRLQRLACFQSMAFASYVLNWYLGPQQGNAPCDKSSWELVVDYRGYRLWISDSPGSGEIHIHALPGEEPPPEIVRELERIISFLLENTDDLTGAIASLL